MRLSVETQEVYQKFGIKEGITLLKEAGFDAIDFTFCDLGEDSLFYSDKYREFALEIKKHIDEIGIVCNQAHAPFNLVRDEKPDMSEPHYNEIVRAIECASILGAETIVVHPVYVPVGETVDGVSYEDYNYKYYKSLEPYCEKFKIRIAVENMFYVDSKRKYRRGMLHTPESLTAMVKSLNSPYFVACVDIGHLAITSRTEPDDFITEMEPEVLTTLHIHDNDYIMDKHMLPFTGDLDWETVMKSLRKMNYSGDLTFEICGYLKRFPNELMPDALRLAAAVGRHLISIFNKAE